jgi:hypothetical protein
MPTVGYLDGVDPLMLTRLAIRGVGTLPVSNGFDNHGKFINAITERDAVDVVVGHLHKLLRTRRQGFLVEDLLDSCYSCGVSVLVIAPREDHDRARELLGPANDRLLLIGPGEAYDEIVRELRLPA